MKPLLITLLLLSPLYNWAQNQAFYKKTILALELSNGDTLNKKELVTYYDSLKNIIKSQDNISNAVSGDKRIKQEANKILNSIIEVKNDSLYIKADIDEKGNIVGKIIYKYDKNGNQTHYYQITKGDTVVAQKRIFNDKGDYIELYNKDKHKLEYFLSAEWKYDDKRNPIEKKSYNNENQLIELIKYENTYKKNGEINTLCLIYQNGKGYVKKYKVIEYGNIKKTYFYTSYLGYNYGIELKHIKGGYKIEEFNKNKKLVKLEYFDNKNKKIAFVEIIEETLKL
jgi:hypothetical protein